MTDEVLSTSAQNQLKSFVERVENLEVEKKEVADQIKDVLEEAKGTGFDKKIIRQIVKIRKKSRAERQEEAALVDLYLEAVGDPT